MWSGSSTWPRGPSRISWTDSNACFLVKTRALRVDGNAGHLAGVIQDQDCDRQPEPLGFDMLDKEFRLDARGAYGSNGAVRGHGAQDERQLHTPIDTGV